MDVFQQLLIPQLGGHLASTLLWSDDNRISMCTPQHCENILLLYFAIVVIQEAGIGQAVVVVSIYVYCGELLARLVCSVRVCETGEQIIVLELGG